MNKTQDAKRHEARAAVLDFVEHDLGQADALLAKWDGKPGRKPNRVKFYLAHLRDTLEAIDEDES